jgi:lysophospholipase L1-like esterase
MEKIICVFGSSIAWGAWDEMGGWVSRLRNYLTRDHRDYFDVYNLAIDGDDSKGVLKRFSAENEVRRPGIIIVSIGMNDSYYANSKNDPNVPIEKFQNNLGELLTIARKCSSKIIFVGLTDIDEIKTKPVPWNKNVNYDKENVALYNMKIKEFCEKNNLKFIEMQGLLNKDDLEDGLHPNAKGHEKMFLKVKDFLVKNKIV